MQTIVFVAAARPNFMKIAPILRAMDRADGVFTPLLVHTGQHYDASMSDVFFQQLRIRRPDVSLGVGSGTHGEQTGRTLIAFEKLLLERAVPPAAVVVVGDVNATVACALAAVKLGIPVAHVEAGLRSFDRSMPEEINRILTDAISDLLLVTEESGVANLRREGVAEEKIEVVGNVMIDTLLGELESARATRHAERLGLEPRRYGLVTLHRPSNVDDPSRLAELVRFLRELSRRISIVFPVHPRTRARLEAGGHLGGLDEHVTLTEPLGYHENLALMDSARFVITDSGGMQEETSVLGVPCLTLRRNTERPITVSAGTSTLVGDDLARAAALVDDVLEGRYKSGGPIPLWDGHAAERIVETFKRTWASQ